MPENKRNILNIGCGKKIIDGAINIDIIESPEVIKHDIRQGIPFANERFDEVIADYILCQICDPQEFKYVMNEIYRVLKIGGLLKLKVPNARFPCVFQDPMDCRYFVKETFDYFNKDHYRFKVFNYGFEPWEIVKIEEIGQKEDSKIKDRLYVEMRKSLTNYKVYVERV